MKEEAHRTRDLLDRIVDRARTPSSAPARTTPIAPSSPPEELDRTRNFVLA
jgi:hypothetical protein